MVLLSNDNNNTIKQNHILKCLEQKKMSFNIFVLPNTLKENNITDNNKNIKIVVDNQPDISKLKLF